MPGNVMGGIPHRNSGLFADHYLDVTLPERQDWLDLAEEAGTVLEEVAAVFRNYTPGNEAQTEEALIRPILRALGHTFDVQVSLATPPEGVKIPDYVLYRDEASLVANRGRTLNEDDLKGRAVAVGEVKAWDRPLDDSLKGSSRSFDNRNPSYQISFYLRYAATEWGILTNGRLWRLYHSKGNVAGCSSDTKRLVYFVSSLSSIQRAGLEFVFSDGHATKAFTHIYDDTSHLNKIDWPLMKEEYWRDTEEDGDKSRRRQAEFLIHGNFPWEAVEYLVVKNMDMKRRLEGYLRDSWPQMVRPVESRADWYF